MPHHDATRDSDADSLGLARVLAEMASQLYPHWAVVYNADTGQLQLVERPKDRPDHYRKR